MYSLKDIDNKYTNETILLNFNKKYKFNLNIVKDFKGFYNDLIFILQNNNNMHLLKNFVYTDELYLLFHCYNLFFYYLVKKKINICTNGFIFFNKFVNIQLIDFLNKEYNVFFKIIKLLLKYRYKKKIIYHFRYVNIDFISMKVTNNNTYKIFKYLLKNNLINIKKEDIEKFNYYKQINNSYYFKKFLIYLKIDIKQHDKTKKNINILLLTQKSLKKKKLFDTTVKITYVSQISDFYKKNNYFRNIKYY